MAAYLLGDFIGTIYKFPMSIRNKCEMVTLKNLPTLFRNPFQAIAFGETRCEIQRS